MIRQSISKQCYLRASLSRLSNRNTLTIQKQRDNLCSPSATTTRFHNTSSLLSLSSSSTSSPIFIRSGLSSGTLPYTKGWAWQQTLLNHRLDYLRKQSQQQEDHAENNNHINVNVNVNVNNNNNIHQDCLLLFQHEPVYTLGRGADENNLTFLDKEQDGGEQSRLSLSRKSRGKGSARLSMDKPKPVEMNGNGFDCNQDVEEVMRNLSENIIPVIAPNGAPIYRIERGGEVTFHGPGQLVGYPLINLKGEPYKQDLHWYLRMVEEVVIETLSHYDIVGVRDEINTGVWVNEKKIAAIGVSASKWITTHGFAINVSSDLSFFDTSIIIPCGIVGRGVTSIAEVMKERNQEEDCPSLEEVAKVTRSSFERVFGVPTCDGDDLQ